MTAYYFPNMLFFILEIPSAERSDLYLKLAKVDLLVLPGSS
jgi:hypothetical protein